MSTLAVKRWELGFPPLLLPLIAFEDWLEQPVSDAHSCGLMRRTRFGVGWLPHWLGNWTILSSLSELKSCCEFSVF